LLKAANRLDEAEPLMRRALIIFITNLGINHPNVSKVLTNYKYLLLAMGWSKEQIIEQLRKIASDSFKKISQ